MDTTAIAVIMCGLCGYGYAESVQQGLKGYSRLFLFLMGLVLFMQLMFGR
jgi:hypothetical protein